MKRQVRLLTLCDLEDLVGDSGSHTSFSGVFAVIGPSVGDVNLNDQ